MNKGSLHKERFTFITFQHYYRNVFKSDKTNKKSKKNSVIERDWRNLQERIGGDIIETFKIMKL